MFSKKMRYSDRIERRIYKQCKLWCTIDESVNGDIIGGLLDLMTLSNLQTKFFCKSERNFSD